MEAAANIVLPINHPSNRRGDVVFSNEDCEIRQTKSHYYVWLAPFKYGVRVKTLGEATEAANLRWPEGYADLAGTKRLGHVVEKNQMGEIRKHGRVYYVFLADQTEAIKEGYLNSARALLGINTAPRKEIQLTAPKSSYPQNQKGYRADSLKAQKSK